MSDPDINFPEVPVKPLATAGVMAAGASLLFPTAASTAGLLSAAGGAGVATMPVLAVLGAFVGAVAGWYLGKAIFVPSPAAKDAKEECTTGCPLVLPRQPGVEPSLHPPSPPQKEWRSSAELQKDAQAVRER